MGYKAVFTSVLAMLCSVVAAPVASAATTVASGQAGFFVIGEPVAVPGATVEFWGAQWAKANLLNDAPASFKGFAGTVDNLTCPTVWSARTGNSTPPPASVPGDITVIVTSSVSQVGPVISGNVVELATVQTEPGYEGDPGHAGYGTVVGIERCAGGGATAD